MQKASLALVLLALVPSAISARPAFASSVRVTQTDELVIMLRQAVQKQYKVPAHDVLVLWNDSPLESKLKTLGPNLSVEVSEQELKNLLNKRVLYLKAYDAQKKFRSTLQAKIKVNAWSEAYKLTEALEKGEALSEKKIKKVRESLAVLPQNYLKKITFLGEYEALKALDAGTVLTRYMLKQRPIVLKGSQIKVQVVNDNLTLTASGEALESGVRGQDIKVKILNFGSNKIVTAKVSGEGQVTLIVK